MNDNAQIITKKKPHLDDQITAVRKFEVRLKEEVRHVAEMIEKDMAEYIGSNVLDDEVLERLYTLVAAAEETQVNLTAYFYDACVNLLKTQEERDDEEKQEREDYEECQAYQAQVREDYYHAVM